MLLGINTNLPSHFNKNVLDVPTSHPVVFDALDASVVHAAALHTVGATGPSGVDACECMAEVVHFFLWGFR